MRRHLGDGRPLGPGAGSDGTRRGGGRRREAWGRMGGAWRPIAGRREGEGGAANDNGAIDSAGQWRGVVERRGHAEPSAGQRGGTSLHPSRPYAGIGGPTGSQSKPEGARVQHRPAPPEETLKAGNNEIVSPLPRLQQHSCFSKEGRWVREPLSGGGPPSLSSWPPPPAWLLLSS